MGEREPRVLVERYGPYALLLVIAAFMVWVRMLPADRVITSSGVFYPANDPWYHNRMVHFAVRYFPSTTPFDPWSLFPYGTGRHSGFGGLFDQLIALASLIVGLGSPSDRLINVVTAVSPPVFGAATAIPTYLVGRRLTDRWWGLVPAILLALAGGGILQRTVVGAADHQAAESLFGAIAAAGFLYAIAVAYRESPMLEDVLDRNWEFLRTPVLKGIVGGLAIASYLMLWPPGVMLVFTFGIFVVIQMAREHFRGDPTDPLALATVVSMGTATIVTLGYAKEFSLSGTAFSLVQPLVTFAIAIGALFLLGLSRYAEREGYDRQYYPPAIGGIILAGFVVSWLLVPPVINLFESLFTRVYSFGYFTGATAGTVAEIQPGTVDQAFAAHGTILWLSIIGFALLVYRVYTDSRPEDLLVILWTLTMFSAFFSMARFGYYLAVNVVLLAGFAVWWISVRLLQLDWNLERLRKREISTYQVIGVLIILILIIPGNVVGTSGQSPVWEQTDRHGGVDPAWADGMEWMEGNTPEVPLDYYAQYERPSDSDFEYPERAYGVMSWWDYGHWITVMGERIPYANPFQEGTTPASAYLQATNETRANLLLEALPSDQRTEESVHDMSIEELREVIADQPAHEAQENGRYVAIDDQMAGPKFPAITQFTGPGLNAYADNELRKFQDQNVTLPITSSRYERMMLSRLYYDDASGLEHYRLVHEVDRYTIVGGHIDGERVRFLRLLSLRGGWNDVAGIAAQLQQARQAEQVVPIGGDEYVFNARVNSRVKLYERVEGATLSGTVPNETAETPVYAILRLQTHTGRNFSYVQQTTTDADGTFEVTVPYATDNTVPPEEGGTDSSVRARGAYQVQSGTPFNPTGIGEAEVPEEAIYEGREIEVTLEPIEREETETELEVNETDGNETDTNAGNDSADLTGNESTADNESVNDLSLRSDDLVRSLDRVASPLLLGRAVSTP